MRTAGVVKELSMVVVGHSPIEDTHDGYGDIKNDLSIIDRKPVIMAQRFNNFLDYKILEKIKPAMADLNRAIPLSRK